MKGLENIAPEVAKDLIKLVNSLQKIPKSAKVIYNVLNKNTNTWTKKEFNYVPLDDILEKIKEDNNFALIQPIGVDETGTNGVKCVLIHKTGHVIESNTYPFVLSGSNKPQDVGAEITYYKRYSLGAFLGISTDEDTDGNDENAEQVVKEEKKISPKQKEMLMKYYVGENLEKLLEANNIKDLSELPMSKGSELISAIMNKK